ncbi:pre-peptidase C-terminal domain-containing protein [Nostoc sp. XA010]|uniref:pre-peptidase C-terminal domain-containing protein n=1 Tax=Nostoc sp. XA010 TaxID=2780407 RepID=UPI001E65B4D3|nr:pre-peptidase C-terminal domain-containing protein [Nostoc sp. XA010]MCC5660049.1 pre-peptidase C-terminal domain-containing protein [Nostoc sp. XA010]
MAVNLFDASFYRIANADLARAGLTDAQLVSHFQNFGIDEGRAFSAFADLNFYRSSNSDLASFNNRQAYEHLGKFGVAEGRQFSQFFDVNFYLDVNPDVKQAFGGNRERAYEHARGLGVNEGREFSPFIYDLNDYYLQVNPDLKQAFGDNRAKALEHLVISGVREGRSFSPFVDINYYLSNNSDVNQAFGGDGYRAFGHLQTFGLNEGRRFTPAFDVNYYRNTYSDLRNAGLTTNRQLFQHWVNYGAFSDERSGTPDPGNSLNTALNLGNQDDNGTIFNGFIGGSDTIDYYCFTLTDVRSISAGVGFLDADLDLSLLDANGNPLLTSSSFNNTGDGVTYYALNPGTYYIQVYPGVNDASSDYNLVVASSSILDASNTLSSALPLEGLNVPQSSGVFRDTVGGSDTNDYYKFIVDENLSLSASLSPSTADADLFLLNSNGSIIRSSMQSGTNTDSISNLSLNPGTYYIRIQGFSSNTVYTLNATTA